MFFRSEEKFFLYIASIPVTGKCFSVTGKCFSAAGKFFSVTGGRIYCAFMYNNGRTGRFPASADMDYAILGINKDKTTHTPAIIPDTSPLAFFLQAAKRMITWEAKQQFPGGESRAAMPEGNWLRIQAATVAQGVIPTEADYKPQASSGKTRFVTKHTVAEIGMDIWVRLAYENSAGMGPWSIGVKAVII